ncbi:DUF6993 domain-containing protein [Microbacterium sp. A93]|uniref:DUF6993 domain-containing protein n=1 Tax=unclassified Microbacterium TaxID=2609290 RepID=UPI003F4256A5
MPRRILTARRRSVIATSMLLAGLALAACTSEATPEPEDTTTSAPAPTASSTPEGPTFHIDGTAEDNLPIFTAVVEQVSASPENAAGRAYIDALVAAGFDRAGMQVTQDATTVGNPAESLQFSVRWGDDLCLIGQVGPSTGAPVTAIMDQLAEGRCLIGNTRSIDW